MVLADVFFEELVNVCVNVFIDVIGDRLVIICVKVFVISLFSVDVDFVVIVDIVDIDSNVLLFEDSFNSVMFVTISFVVSFSNSVSSFPVVVFSILIGDVTVVSFLDVDVLINRILSLKLCSICS